MRTNIEIDDELMSEAIRVEKLGPKFAIDSVSIGCYCRRGAGALSGCRPAAMEETMGAKRMIWMVLGGFGVLLPSVAAAQVILPPVWLVSETGTDSASCGITAATACRSIGQAITNAAAGDVVSVGPGRYGDLNNNGVLGEPGEERGGASCDCVLPVDKAVTVRSSRGAAATFIDVGGMETGRSVFISATGAVFGLPGRGFTVFATDALFFPVPGSLPDFISDGIVIAATDGRVSGNHVATPHGLVGFQGIGIRQILDGPVVIEGNVVAGWRVGISVLAGATVSRNQVQGGQPGIEAKDAIVKGNVVSDFQASGIVLTGLSGIATNNTLAIGTRLGVGPPIGTGIQVRVNVLVGAAPVVARGNNFMGLLCGVAGSVATDASRNYWGTPAGPHAPNASMACGDESDLLLTPFATKPFSVTPLKP